MIKSIFISSCPWAHPEMSITLWRRVTCFCRCVCARRRTCSRARGRWRTSSSTSAVRPSGKVPESKILVIQLWKAVTFQASMADMNALRVARRCVQLYTSVTPVHVLVHQERQHYTYAGCLRFRHAFTFISVDDKTVEKLVLLFHIFVFCSASTTQPMACLKSSLNLLWTNAYEYIHADAGWVILMHLCAYILHQSMTCEILST